MLLYIHGLEAAHDLVAGMFQIMIYRSTPARWYQDAFCLRVVFWKIVGTTGIAVRATIFIGNPTNYFDYLSE